MGSPVSTRAQDCGDPIDYNVWCTEENPAAFNNMHAGTFGELFKTIDLSSFWLCGFQFLIGSGGGIVGSIVCTEDVPCRALLYHVLEDDTVEELASIELTEEVSGLTDFFFESAVLIESDTKYAVVIETQDNEWGLWQWQCEPPDDCCPNASGVKIEGGQAIYNDPSNDDYDFLLWIDEPPTPAAKTTWGSIKTTYR